MRLIILSIIFTIFTLGCDARETGKISISEQWIRSAPAGVSATTAFMTINNSGSRLVKLLGATSDIFSRIELHRTQMDTGMMKMMRQDNIPIMANDKTILKPGSWHIMLFEPVKMPATGDEVSLILRFDNGAEIAVKAKVIAE